jgi:hypothetical protein
MSNWNGMLIVVGSFNYYKHYGTTFSSTSSSDSHLGCVALAACLAAAPVICARYLIHHQLHLPHSLPPCLLSSDASC